MEWLWIIGAIVWGAIWGFVAYSIVLNRGYPKEEANKWEFVGFFSWDNRCFYRDGCKTGYSESAEYNYSATI